MRTPTPNQILELQEDEAEDFDLSSLPVDFDDGGPLDSFIAADPEHDRVVDPQD